MNIAAVLKALRPRFGVGRRSTWGAATLGSWRASEVSTRTWATGADSYDTAYVEPAANAIIQATTLWLCRAFPEAPLRVQRRARDGGLEPIPNHPLTQLVANPTPFYGGPLLWHATIADWMLTGNAFWLKVRKGTGMVDELWWLPAQTVRVVPDQTGDRFVESYDYTPMGGRDPVRYPPADVVHFRYGMDPANPTCGLSPLGALLREVLTDDEASRFSASLLRNMAVPGVILSPAEPVSQTDAEAVKSKFRDTFGGSRRGDVLVMRAPSTVSVLSFSPQQMDLKALRRLPEERVSAVLGIPAVVVGLGAGLDRSTFSNFEEARQAAYESNVIPTQRMMAAELQTQLLPDVGDATSQQVDFDLGQVRVLQPDLDKLWARLDVGVQGGWVMLNEARAQVGLPALPDGDVLYVGVAKTPTDPAELLAPPEPVAPPTPLRALPPAEGEPPKALAGAGTKAAHTRYPPGLERIRARTAPPLERAVARELASQRARVIQAISAQQKAFSVDDVIASLSDAAGLLRAVQRAYRAVLAQVVPLAEGTLGVPAQPDALTVADYLAEAGLRVAGITETTRQALVDALRESVALGESTQQTAARVEELTAFGRPRATTISRTEVGHASQLASLSSFRASGVVSGILVLDGDGCGLHSHDGEPKANGMRIPLERMGDVPTLAHPNCVRSFSPLVDAAELVGAA